MSVNFDCLEVGNILINHAFKNSMEALHNATVETNFKMRTTDATNFY